MIHKSVCKFFLQIKNITWWLLQSVCSIEKIIEFNVQIELIKKSNALIIRIILARKDFFYHYILLLEVREESFFMF